MSTYVLRRDSPPVWHELLDGYPEAVQIKQPQKVRIIEAKTLPTQDDLPSCDKVSMEAEQYRFQMELLVNSLKPWLYQSNRGYVNGNMFVYFSPDQIKNEDFRSPNVFVVLGVSNHVRKSWVIWDEGKVPDIMIELLSETTIKTDKSKKKRIYQDKLKVPEYYWFDPNNPNDFQGFKLADKVYEELPLTNNSFVSQSLGLKLFRWHGVYEDVDTVWLRWKTLNGKLLLLPVEIEAKQAEEKAKQARKEARRAYKAERLVQVALSEGERKGRLTEKQETARKMLADGLAYVDVMKYTGLSNEELVILSK